MEFDALVAGKVARQAPAHTSARWMQVMSARSKTPSSSSRSKGSRAYSDRINSCAGSSSKKSSFFVNFAWMTPRSQWTLSESRQSKHHKKVRAHECPPLLSSSPTKSLDAAGLEIDDGSQDVNMAAQILAEKLERLEKLHAEFAMERGTARNYKALLDSLGLVRATVNLLRQGGDVPFCFCIHSEAKTFAGPSFASRIPDLVGSFLVTKCVSTSKPQRALYVIKGMKKGRVALRKLPALGPGDDPEVKKLATRSPDAPGGWTAQPNVVQRFLSVVTPATLVSWVSHVLAYDVPQCEEEMQKAILDAKSRNERARELKLNMLLFNARAGWRVAMKQQRGHLFRELWACLWNSYAARVQSVAMALRRIGVSMTDKIFHEVTINGPGWEKYFVVLEEAGATSEEIDAEWHETLNFDQIAFVKRHATASVADAYECMREDSGAPVGTTKMRTWLEEECGHPCRKHWASEFCTKDKGRNMMISNSFVQQILVDLVNTALAVKIPEVPERVEDLPAELLDSVEQDS